MSGDELELRGHGDMVASGTGAPAIEAVAAGLRRDGADLSLYGGFLINTLTEALPEDMITIERKRTGADRLRGRDGTIVGVRVDLGDRRFALTRAEVGARPSTSIAHVSGGVAMSTTQVDLDAWAQQLAGALVAAAGRDAAAAEAAARLAIPGGGDL